MQRRIGIEHEFTVRHVGGRHDSGVIDARKLLPGLQGLGPRLDPADRHARRGPWGGVVTCDAKELEVVTPPTLLAPVAVGLTAGLALAGRRAVEAALPDDLALRGYSTHLNVEVRDRLARRIADVVATRLAIPVMFALDRPASPGLLVRPRHRRLELGGEYVRGDHLRVAITLAVGATLLGEQLAARLRSRGATAPPVLDVRLQRPPQRFGWFVDRRAFGPDVYRDGRSARVWTEGGRALRVADLLTICWTAMRPLVEPCCDGRDVAAVDAVIEGRSPFAVESERCSDDEVTEVFGHDIARAMTRGAVSLTAVTATWRAVVFDARCDGRRRFVTVPGEAVDHFLQSWQAGDLDAWFADRVFCIGKRRSSFRNVGLPDWTRSP